jgi:hypothetical protein
MEVGDPRLEEQVPRINSTSAGRRRDRDESEMGGTRAACEATTEGAWKKERWAGRDVWAQLRTGKVASLSKLAKTN